jgi:hypothetical protein
MRASLVAAAVLVPAFALSCAQPLSPTETTPFSQVAPATASSDAMGVTTTIAVGAGVVAGVPFKGEFEARLTQSTPLDPPLLSNLNEGAGHATQLGRFTLRIPHVVNTMTRVATGTYEFTAVNGDTLLAAFTGQATPIAPGVLAVVDAATITGGTGRFADAAGSFTVERVFTAATGQITASFTGTISAVSASKP